MKTHMFAICAYKESPYLESCIRSLKRQSVRSGIIMCTSTPNSHISSLAEKYDIPLYVRDGESGLGADWNYALSCADAHFVTLAHQDDLYHRDYTKHLFRAIEDWPDMSLFSSSYVLIRGGKTVGAGAAGFIKKILRLPLKVRLIAGMTLVKKSVLCLGNPIVCPSCTYDKSVTGDNPFSTSSRFIPDWENLWRMASEPGRFICDEKPLLAYRIHRGSQTEKLIRDNTRFTEEEAMFDSIWPRPVSRLLMRFYRLAARAYR